jgi:hypothetical protein
MSYTLADMPVCLGYPFDSSVYPDVLVLLAVDDAPEMMIKPIELPAPFDVKNWLTNVAPQIDEIFRSAVRSTPESFFHAAR